MRRRCEGLTTRGRRLSGRRGVLRRLWLVVLAVGVLLAGFSSLAASDPLDPHLTTFEAFMDNPDLVPTVGYAFGLEAHYNDSMPGWVHGSMFEWIDGDWSLLTDSCFYVSCVTGVEADSPEEIARAHDRRFRIVLYSEGDPYDSMDLVVHEKRLHFTITMDFENLPGYVMTYIPNAMGNTDLSTVIHEDGSAINSCNIWWNNCSAEIADGHVYYASVEDRDGNVYGMTPSYRATSSTTATKETADQVDLSRLGTLYPTTTDVCNTLLTFPYGSHVEEESPTDQYLACDTAVANRLSMTALLQAVAVAGTGTTGVLWWLEHQGTVQVLSPNWPTVPWPDAQVPAIEDLPQVWQGAVIGLADHYMLQARGRDLTQAAAMAIAATCLWDASGIANDGLDVCRTLPIFVTGSDVAEATDHDVEAIADNPSWFKLNYEASGAKTGQHSWVNSKAPCNSRTPSGQQCDEYPFWASEQGGPYARPTTAHLRYIDEDDNQLQGSRYSTFIRYCGLTTGTRPEGEANATGGTTFLVVALPSGLGIPSYTRLCNR